MSIAVDPNRTVPVTLEPFGDDFNYESYAEPGRSEVKYPDETGCMLQFACPGCGKFGQINVCWGPKLPHCWKHVSGDRTDPTTWTLDPSIFCVGCCKWHGYLKAGVYKSC